MMELNKCYMGLCEDLIKSIPEKSVDLIITDPPYEFINKNPVGGGFMAKDNKKYLQNVNDTFGMSYNPKNYLVECKRIMKIFNAYFFTNKSLLMDYISFAEANNYLWDILVWFKPNPVPLNNQHYLIDKEYCVYIKEKGATFNTKEGFNRYYTVKTFPIGGSKEFDHPTVKPISFIEDLVLISSKEGDLVFDGYCGSGTTLVASKKHKRNYLGFEKESKFMDIISKRLKGIISNKDYIKSIFSM